VRRGICKYIYTYLTAFANNVVLHLYLWRFL